MTLSVLSAGESHGPCLTGMLEGLPANLPLDLEEINRQLARRQQGYGRGGRMAIEKDRVEVTAGLRFSRTTGAPLSFLCKTGILPTGGEDVSGGNPRLPGLSPSRGPGRGMRTWRGGLKYRQEDLRNILERASARETAMRVAVGSVARLLLREFGIHIYSHVVAIGGIWWQGRPLDPAMKLKPGRRPPRCALPMKSGNRK
jgi:chorismate synthase